MKTKQEQIGVQKMNWNWLGWLFWIGAIAMCIFTVKYIRNHQLMLIAKTHQRFSSKLFWQYVGLTAIALLWLGSMTYLTFFREVDVNNSKEVSTSEKYAALQLGSTKKGFYYVVANRSKMGKHPVVSYTYWTKNTKYTTNSRYGSIADSDHFISTQAAVYPWNRKRLAKENDRTGHAFMAEMTVRYKNTLLNGLGVRCGRVATTHTLLRIPGSNMIYLK